MILKRSKRHFVFPLFSLLFIALPVYSTMETADPGAGEVLALVIPTLLFGIAYLRLQLKPYHISAFLMWFFCTLVTLVGPFTAETNLMQIIKYLAFVIFFLVVSSYKFTAKDISFVTKGYVVIAVIVAALIFVSFLGGYQHLEREGGGGSFYYMGRYSIGITGLYKNPNYLASFICVAALIVLYKLKMSTMTLKKQVLCVGIYVLFFVSCFLTGTRASLVVLISIALGLLLSSFKKNANPTFLLVTILIVGLLIVRYGTQISEMFDAYLAGREMLHDEGREQAWPLAIRFFKENFLLGSGIDAWHHLSHNAAALNNLHNVFLEFLVNQGFVGLLLLAHTLFWGFRKAKKADRFFLLFLLFVTAFLISFQNGVIAVNFWRFIIINRLALNYSIYSEEGITALFITNKIICQENVVKKTRA